MYLGKKNLIYTDVIILFLLVYTNYRAYLGRAFGLTMAFLHWLLLIVIYTSIFALAHCREWVSLSQPNLRLTTRPGVVVVFKLEGKKESEAIKSGVHVHLKLLPLSFSNLILTFNQQKKKNKSVSALLFWTHNLDCMTWDSFSFITFVDYKIKNII